MNAEIPPENEKWIKSERSSPVGSVHEPGEALLRSIRANPGDKTEWSHSDGGWPLEQELTGTDSTALPSSVVENMTCATSVVESGARNVAVAAIEEELFSSGDESTEPFPENYSDFLSFPKQEMRTSPSPLPILEKQEPISAQSTQERESGVAEVQGEQNPAVSKTYRVNVTFAHGSQPSQSERLQQLQSLSKEEQTITTKMSQVKRKLFCLKHEVTVMIRRRSELKLAMEAVNSEKEQLLSLENVTPKKLALPNDPATSASSCSVSSSESKGYRKKRRRRINQEKRKIANRLKARIKRAEESPEQTLRRLQMNREQARKKRAEARMDEKRLKKGPKKPACTRRRKRRLQPRRH